MAYGISTKKTRNSSRFKIAPNGSKSHDFNNNMQDKKFDSKLKLSAQQFYEKYTSLALEAMVIGDRVTAEGYYQHAEHYLRLMKDYPPIFVEENIFKKGEFDEKIDFMQIKNTQILPKLTSNENDGDQKE